MIRKDGYKLILRYPYQEKVYPNELYDLKADPRETTNLYTNPSYSQLILQLSSQIEKFFAVYTLPGHSGLDVEHQPIANAESPWLPAAVARAVSP